MPRPNATIIIPCFNHGRFVADAVESALAQTDADVRVVVIDDGSDDGTTPDACDALLDRFGTQRLDVIHQDNNGLPGARNRGAADATTQYLAFLDADDTIAPDFVSTLATAIEHDQADRDDAIESLAISHAYCQETLTDRAHGTWRVPEWDPELLLITNLHPVTCLVRRDAFEAVGGFDASMTEGYEDWEFWVRLSERGYRGVRVTEPLFFWRRHSRETMIHDAVAKHDSLYAQIIDRHRDLYERHFEALTCRCNSMLRAFDCNWIDETGTPIPLQYLQKKTAETHGLERSLHAVRQELTGAREHAESCGKRCEAVRAEYDAMAGVRLHRRARRLLATVPGFVRRPARFALRLLSRAIAGG
jgi:glycosyltransferase involved in cell wall biosynthesis